MAEKSTVLKSVKRADAIDTYFRVYVTGEIGTSSREIGICDPERSVFYS